VAVREDEGASRCVHSRAAHAAHSMAFSEIRLALPALKYL
jgi:hypothetical protein